MGDLMSGSTDGGTWLRAPRIVMWRTDWPAELAEAANLASDLHATAICLPGPADETALRAARAECSRRGMRLVVSLIPDAWELCVAGRAREAFRQVLVATFAGAPPDGIMIPAWGAAAPCRCDACAAAFLGETGCAIPLDVADPADETVWGYLAWLDARATEWPALVVQTVRETVPGCAVILPAMAHPGMEEGADAVVLPPASVEIGDDRLLAPRPTRGDRPALAPVPYSWAVNADGSGMARPTLDLQMDLVGCLAVGAFPVVLDPTIHDRRAVRAARETFGLLREHAEALGTAEQAPSGGIVLAWQDAGDRPTGALRRVLAGRHVTGVEADATQAGLYLALVREHVPARRVPRAALANALDRASVVCLADVVALADDERKLLRRFVRKGGGLVVCGQAGATDDFGHPVPSFGLGDVLGIEAGPAPRRLRRGWLRFDASHPIAATLPRRSAIPIAGEVLSVTPEPTAAAPAHWHAAEGPPMPAIVAHRFGQGRAVWVAGAVAASYRRTGAPDLARLLANCVRWAAGDAVPAYLDGPDTVHVSLGGTDDRLLVHLLNRSADLSRPVAYVAPASDLPVWVRLPRGSTARRARSVGDRMDLLITPTEGGIWCVLTHLELYDLLLVDLDRGQAPGAAPEAERDLARPPQPTPR